MRQRSIVLLIQQIILDKRRSKHVHMYKWFWLLFNILSHLVIIFFDTSRRERFNKLTNLKHCFAISFRLIENTLGQLLQTTESVCGQKDYRTLTRVMVDFDGDLSFVTGAFDDESAHCVISVNRVVPDAGVSVEVSQA